MNIVFKTFCKLGIDRVDVQILHIRYLLSLVILSDEIIIQQQDFRAKRVRRPPLLAPRGGWRTIILDPLLYILIGRNCVVPAMGGMEDAIGFCRIRWLAV